jgi:hypothetical protein
MFRAHVRGSRVHTVARCRVSENAKDAATSAITREPNWTAGHKIVRVMPRMRRQRHASENLGRTCGPKRVVILATPKSQSLESAGPFEVF